MKTTTSTWLALGAGSMLMVLSVAVRADALKGAIFTTNQDGTVVNQNLYSSKTDVYLDGGPGSNAPLSAASLPDGTYVFQVTDPSGKVLLSSDPANCRQFTVVGGQITSAYCHKTGVDTNDGGITVQLYPFLNTPNPGGVYKAWVTPLSAYVARVGNAGVIAAPVAATCIAKNGSPSKCTGGSTPSGYARDAGFGPPRDQQKTDNFKIQELHPPFVHVRKFEDTNGNGVLDAEDQEIDSVHLCVDLNGHKSQCSGAPGGWPITITDPLDGTTTGSTATNSYFTPTQHVHGNFGPASVCETVLAGWTFEKVYLNDVNTTPASYTGAEVCVAVDNLKTQTVKFLNFKDVTLKACKTDETNAPVQNYPINFIDGDTVSHVTTGADGCVTSTYPGPRPNGSYRIEEGSLPDFFPLDATPCTSDQPPQSGKEYDCSFRNQRSRTTGRFTGGGSTSSIDLDGGKVRVTQGLELHCSTSALPNNLEVNWGPGNRFHLDRLTTVGCFDDPAIAATPPDANFDTIIGTGAGSCNGVSGATIAFTLKDAGEPGTNDRASITLSCPAGSGVSGLTVSGTGSKVNKGNLQAHF